MKSLKSLFMIALMGVLPMQVQAAEDENPYAVSYTPRELRAKIVPAETDEPQIYKGSDDKEADYQRMLEKGFDMIGSASFEAGNVPPEKLIEHAKSVNAQLVLVSTRRSGDLPASVKIDRLRQQARERNTDTVDPEALNEGTSVRYAYYASYWVKLAPPLIGLHVRGPGKDDKEKGLTVLAVINGSPAEKAALQELDLIKRLGDEVLDNPEALSKAAQRYAGQTVEVEYMRHGDIMIVPLTLNQAY